MKRILLSPLTAILIVFFAFGLSITQVMGQAAQMPADASKNPVDSKKKAFVLLELYTSEGCPTCPPADANLAFLEKEQPFADAEVVTLALHVDYWNSLKWKDEYSSPLFSRRQQLYSQALKTGVNYTPQMIVDGRAELIGNNMAKAQKAILEAVKTPKAAIEITQIEDKFKINISDIPPHANATVFLAVTEDNLAANRKYGSNADRKAEHQSVVRELKSLGILTEQQMNLELESVLQILLGWKRENLKIVVFVQENVSRKILGVARKSLK